MMVVQYDGAFQSSSDEASIGASLSSSSSIGASSSSLSSSLVLLTPWGPGDTAACGDGTLSGCVEDLLGMFDGGALKIDFRNSVVSV